MPDVPQGLDYYGQFATVAPALALLGRLRMALGIPDEQLALLLPATVLPGVTSCYGLAVIRADVAAPMLGLKPAEQ